MLTIEKIKKDFNNFKSYTKKSVENGKYEDACKLIKTASKIAYNFNFTYTDTILENYIKEISEIHIKKHKDSFKPIKNRYVFYDSFGYDNKGLTQQYIKTLIKLDVEFLYILENENNQCVNIIEEIKSYTRAEIYIVPQCKKQIDKSLLINNKILEYRPEKVFLHIAPWSVEALIVFYSHKFYTKYLIDLTDHAFWLGSDVADYYLSFRSYGEYISSVYRGIPITKIMRQNYYPIISEQKFKGFDFETKGKVVIFTGGTYYKMYGENDQFIKIIVSICRKNPNVIVVIAGSGDSSPLDKMIIDYNLFKQVYLIGNRSDISGVFENIDIYLNTYPIIGGLMSQYAVVKDKPLIGYSSKNIPCNKAEGLFINHNIKFTYDDIDDFHSEMDKMISSKNYRDNKVLEYRNIVPSEDDFFKTFNDNIENSRTINCIENMEYFSMEKFMSLYISMENDYLKSYEKIKISYLKLGYFKYNIIDALICFSKIMVKRFFK